MTWKQKPAAATTASVPAVNTGADIDTDELVDEAGVDPKDIELVLTQVRASASASAASSFRLSSRDFDVSMGIGGVTFPTREVPAPSARSVATAVDLC